MHAFEFFGGARGCSSPITCAPGSSHADRYEPVLNRPTPGWKALAGTAIVPARIRRPRDKTGRGGQCALLANQVAAVLRDRRFIGLG